MVLAAILPWAAGAPVARAQNLPDSVLESQAPDQAAIENYVKTHLENLAKPETAASGRKKLAEPLQRSSTQISSAFRRAYSQQIIAKVSQLSKDPSDDVAVNALRLAGLLGTKDGLEVAWTALDDKREPVRVAAAAAIGVGIGSVQRPGMMLIPRNCTDALDKLSAALQKEKSARVLEALGLALDNAIRVPDSVAAGVRSRAMDILLAQGSRLAKNSPGAEFDGLFGHIARFLSDALAQAEKFSDAQKVEAAGVAGDIIARATRRIEGELTEGQRTELALVVEQSELVIKLAGGVKQNYGLGALIRASDDAKFKAKANELFQDLKSPPFNFPPDRFQPKAP